MLFRVHWAFRMLVLESTSLNIFQYLAILMALNYIKSADLNLSEAGRTVQVQGPQIADTVSVVYNC